MTGCRSAIVRPVHGSATRVDLRLRPLELVLLDGSLGASDRLAAVLVVRPRPEIVPIENVGERAAVFSFGNHDVRVVPRSARPQLLQTQQPKRPATLAVPAALVDPHARPGVLPETPMMLIRADLITLDDVVQQRLDLLLGTPPDLSPVPAADLLEFPPDQIRGWCHRHAVYQLATIELVARLQELVGGRPAIEIAAGYGHIGRALRIPRTDSWLQAEPEVMAYFQSLQQPTIAYPPDVERLTALEAIDHYKPEVVIACWVTQAWWPGRVLGVGPQHELDEQAILTAPSVRRYVMVGNRRTHKDKPIRKLPHAELAAEWIVSRDLFPSENRIFVWTR